ncbi:DUF2254 domain-containing protein [Pseudooceanicola algae]|uniref:DUF2254 domain-containing protein n=1 Tax=Pseudooceanicola algae TaxID=1537215 RepID=A0A418SEM2_9RHOB|nr:DUF2254 domain-containing protein [Pseudooceanicola algae]QPM89689.1 hypothetical protein PSAL_009140 [Pseudooceanicola algae]
MLPSLLRKIHEFSRRLVVRVLLIALLAVLAVLLSKLLGRGLPEGLEGRVGAEAVDRLLSIIANSMLAVTTFSLTVMAAAHRNVSTLWTPRAHQILLEDTTTHTVLATFVGAYLFALLAIILKEMDIFEGPGLVVLFAMTLLVILLIVAAIIRWISHLEMLGSLIGTAQKIEDKTREAWKIRSEFPCLGASPLEATRIPEGATGIRAPQTGYLQEIYQDLLQEAAKKADGRIWITVPVGGFIYQGQVFAHCEGDLGEGVLENIRIGSLRDFVQDPHFGLTCLSEIAVRGLSPGVNDPGTAVDMLRRITRILLDGACARHDGPLHDRLFLPPLDVDALVNRPLWPVLMDGAGRPEMVGPVDETLTALESHDHDGIAEAARALRRKARDLKAD